MELIGSFVDYLTYERNYSARTIHEYAEDLKAFEAFYREQDGELSWNTIDAGVVRQWVVSMMDRGNTARSANRRLSALRSFYKYLLRRGWVEEDPTYGLQGPKKERNLPVFMKEKEMDRLLDGDFFSSDFEGLRDRLMILMFYETGIRLSELEGLNVRDVDVEAAQLKVTGKRNKQRVIPFGRELKAALEQHLAACEQRWGRGSEKALFVDVSGARMSKAKIARVVRDKLALVTTQKKRSPHVLRHTFATSMLNHHANLESVKELLGHESLATTEIYTHTTFEELKKMYNKAHPRA